MKIAVFSDSHGSIDPMLRAVRAFAPDMILHLGDHASDAQSLQVECAIQVKAVRGNCDLGSFAPQSDFFEMGGLRTLMCHGHLHRVKLSLDSLLNAAHFSRADIVLYGHTHVPHIERIGSMLVINPGSVGTGSHPTWAKLIIEDKKASAEIVQV